MANTSEELGLDGENISPLALRTAILLFKDRVPKTLPVDRIGATAFISSSLVVNGAERQMTNTAVHMEKYRASGAKLDGIKIEGPFQIVVYGHDLGKIKGRLLPLARAGNVRVWQVKKMRSHPLFEICPENDQLRALEPVLPPRALAGVHRLVAHFRRHKTEIAYIWQDSTFLLAGLAALIAGVPRIVFTARGMPPNLQKFMYRDEYKDMHKALVQVPGVHYACNGSAAAEAYCRWLDIPMERFTIVPNGVSLPEAKNIRKDTEKWSRFTQATSRSSNTIGGLFRFSEDKKPLFWISFARDFLTRDPDARFVLVGGRMDYVGSGNLLEEAQELARSYGIEDRILFVGESENISYWLQKMDVSVLLSPFEGLPNALIEAQLAGVPIVATPAGSADETFLENETGFLLSNAENPPLSEICDKVEAVFALRARDINLSNKAMKHAGEKFSIDRMIRNTATLLNQG